LARRPAPPTLAIFALLLLADAAGNSLFAHSAARGWWASGIDWLHLVSVSAWLGGLAFFLLFILRASDRGTYDDVVRVGHRFSTLALTSVFVLGLTGLVSTVLIVGPDMLTRPWDLAGQTYGAFLLGKVALFAAMLGLAGLNRFVFLGARPGPDEERPTHDYSSLHPTRANRGSVFARAVGLEATLGVLVLVLAGFLTAVSPPSALAAEPGFLGLQRIGYGDEYNVTLRVDPSPGVGRSSNVSLQIEDASSGAPLEEAIRVRLTIARVGDNESAGETYAATALGGGQWSVGDVLFSRAGAHEARIEIQTEDVYSDVIMVPFDVA
jgi:putative copper export protein